MNAMRFALRSVGYFWRIHLAVALAVVTAAAVLTGALMVGDSVRYSLRALMLDRLGSIHSLLVADHYLSEDLAKRMDSDDGFSKGFSTAVPLILIRNATVEVMQGDAGQRVSGVLLLGIRPDFWSLGQLPAVPLSGRQALVNRPLARQLDLRKNQQLIVRLPQENAVAGDSVMSRKDDRSRSVTALDVVQVLAAKGLARFSLSPTQQDLPLVFLDAELLQGALDQTNRANAVAVGRNEAEPPHRPQQVPDPPRQSLHPTLEDLALGLRVVQRSYQSPDDDTVRTAYRYLHLTTQRMVFSPEAEAALAPALGRVGAEPVITYLANSIERLDSDGQVIAQVPYSTVSAVQAGASLSPLRAADGQPLGPLEDDQIVLNSWTAQQLMAQPGDRIRLRYFDPETTHGQAVEQSAEFTLQSVVPLVEPATPYGYRQPARYSQQPSWANDPDLTPSVEGVTDQQTIEDWDPPFPFDQRRIRPVDEQYWEAYRTTPKAFVALDQGRRLWGSRFGAVTSFRIPLSESQTEASVRKELLPPAASHPRAFGLTWLPLLKDGLMAATGTTPFEGLFIGFSLFIIVAAMLLIALLFRLGVEQRAREAGTLLAVGLTGGRVAGLFLLQGVVLAVAGSALGALAAIGYAQLMVLGLETVWLTAVVAPFIQLHVESRTVIIGLSAGTLVAVLAIGWTCWRLARQPVRSLLGGGPGRTAGPLPRRPWSYPAAALLTVIAIGIGLWAMRLSGEAQAGAFFGSGVCVLVAALVAWRHRLTRRPVKDAAALSLRLATLARRNLVRNPGRSVLTVGLLSSACFLIIAISAFRLPPTEQGTGGFELLAQSDRPIFQNLDDPRSRRDLLGPKAGQLAGTTVVSLRLVDGDDASCRNLYQVAHPRILGVTPGMRAYFDNPRHADFRWAITSQPLANPWTLLTQPTEKQVIPVILDKNTAVYSLHLKADVGEEFHFDYGSGHPLRFRVVGLLANSILQGSLLISEERLTSEFPEVAGYRYFLLDVPEGHQQDVQQVLQSSLRDYGFYATDARRILEQLLNVQNTYLATFQSLGGLGLLLGTVGLAAVQFRNVLERRGELALLLSFGFSRSRLASLVMLEHAMLLLSGLAWGALAALVAVFPHQWAGGAGVPWLPLSAILGVVLAAGLAAGWWAVRQSLRIPLLEALRKD